MSKLTATAHDVISRGALLPLSRLHRVVRASRRPAMVAYLEGLGFRRHARAWSEDRKRGWVLDRLRFAVRRAYQETDYYHAMLEGIGFDPRSDFSFEEFAQLPVLERGDVHRSGRTLLSRALPVDQLKKDSTGGSTGEPTELWLGPEELGWKESAAEHFMRRIGAPSGVRTALLWGHHLDPVAADSVRDRIHNFVENARWFDCLRLSPEVLDRYHVEFRRYRPAVIIAYASALGLLAERVLEIGDRPDYPRSCFVTGAEKLLPRHREAIERAFGKPAHERYGGRDVGYVGFQMNPAESLDFELDWSNLLVEPETDEPESPILITKLHADAMPMIRYRVGDVGLFAKGSRPGHPSFALREVLGRETDRIWLPGGRWITGLQIPHLMKDYPVREYAFVQRPDYSVEIKIAPQSGFDDASRAEILKTVTTNLPGLDVMISLVDQIPRTRANKWRPVVSQVNGAEATEARAT